MEIVDTYFPSGVSTSTLQTQQVHILLSFTLLLTLFTYRFHIMANFRCTPEVHQEESARGTSDYNKFPRAAEWGWGVECVMWIIIMTVDWKMAELDYKSQYEGTSVPKFKNHNTLFDT